MATLGGACRPTAGSRTPSMGANESKVIATVDATQVAPGERLLYLPEGDARGLLGREVTQDANGHTVIAATRRPGCTATITEVPNAYTRDYDRALSDAAGLRAGVQQIAELEGHYERGLRIQLSISNALILRAELVGECGHNVITEVDVGTGERRIVAVAEGGGTVAVDFGVVSSAGASAARERSESEALRWDSAQAWAFRTTDGQVGRAQIAVEMPERLAPGSEFAPRLHVDQSLWLVVLYRDAEGHHGVLVPRGKHVEVLANGELTLPTLVAENLPGHSEDREALLVYGFTEHADYQLFRPPAGAIAPEQADAYAASLQARLVGGEIPRARWTMSEFTYLVAQ